MRGSTGYQVTQVFNNSGILQIGESKHEAKAEARKYGASAWAEMGEQLGIYSYGTAETYKDVWHQFADYAKAELGLKDLEKTTAESIADYLEYRIEQGVAFATYMKDAAALAKFENALNLYSEKFNRGNKYHFREVIREAAKDASKELERADPHRAYDKPDRLVGAIKSPYSKLAASIQLEGGTRIHETSLVKASQLKGLGNDSITGARVGRISVEGKGGKERTVQVSEATYVKLVDVIAQDAGKFSIDKDQYRGDLKAAAAATDQKYTGSHGLRWSFAQERMSTAQEHGHAYEQALKEVSQEMGHERADITEHYLR